MKNQTIIRPDISLLNEGKYVASMCELAFYFIRKYPKFFQKVLEDDTDQFEFRISSKKYDSPFGSYKKENDAFIKTVCTTLFVGWNSPQYDSHISIQITKKDPICICFMHKIDYKDQVDIYFSDHSSAEIKLPGQEEKSYDPSVLSKPARDFFMETIKFTSGTTTTIEKGLDTLEQVFQKLEDHS